MSMTPRHAPLGPSEELYYRHSGMVPFAGVSRAIIGGLAVGVAGAAAYAYLVRRIPFEYVRAALAVALGAVIGFVVARLGQSGKIRNRRATLVLVLLVTLVAYYFAWVFWIKLVLDGWAAQDRVSVGALIRSPGTLWAAIVRVDRTGTWTHDGDPVTGWFLRWAWLYEAAGIFGAAWVASSLMTAREMFCERCDRWVPRGREIRRTAPGDVVMARRRLVAGDVGYVESLSASGDGAWSWWSFTYRRCPGCESLHALTVTESRFQRRSVAESTREADRRPTGKTTKVVHNLLLSPEEAKRLIALPPPAPRPSNTPSERDDGA